MSKNGRLGRNPLKRGGGSAAGATPRAGGKAASLHAGGKAASLHAGGKAASTSRKKSPTSAPLKTANTAARTAGPRAARKPVAAGSIKAALRDLIEGFLQALRRWFPMLAFALP